MEMQKARLANIVMKLYQFRRLRRICLIYLDKCEGGPFFSITLRKILDRYHGVKVGDYSYGACLKPGDWPAGVVVGRFVSIGDGVKVFLRNHPDERISMHPFFYNHKLGFVRQDTINTGQLEIGHDTWIGNSAIILSGCQRIGIGAVVGAGAIVTHDVPDFAIVGGNPARIIRYRFNEDKQKQILASRWWDKSITSLTFYMNSMVIPLQEELPFSSVINT